MSHIAFSKTVPRCASCTRRLADVALNGSRPVSSQVRWKSKSTRNNIVPGVAVRLRRDVKGFGREGTIVPVNRARMRNYWFPERKADYVPFEQVKQMMREGIPIARDFAFGSDEEADEAVKNLEEAIKEPRRMVKQLTPQRSLELIQIFTPRQLRFERSPIKEEEERPTPPVDFSDAGVLQAAQRLSAKPKDISIYGSVSTADIANSIKEALAENEEAARVVISEGDVRFLNPKDDSDTTRVKHLGDYGIEITLKGAETSVTRTVKVLPKR